METQETEKNSQFKRTLFQVAKLYYDEGLTHQQIAEKMSVSRPLITQYLAKARQQGIVHIKVVEPEAQSQEIEEKLLEKTTLRSVRIIPKPHRSEMLTEQAISSNSAKLFLELVSDDSAIGLAWGRNVVNMVNDLPENLSAHKARVLPLFGESNTHNNYTQLNHMVMSVSKALKCKANYLHLPMIVSSESMKKNLMKETDVKGTCSLWNKLDICVMGIGALPPTDGMIPVISQEELDVFYKRGAVGDICGHYYDEDGKFLPDTLEKRLIGVNIKQLKKCPENLAITCGANKATAVLGALRTGIITSLVIDQPCAETVAEML